jgi:hypothetical protein
MRRLLTAVLVAGLLVGCSSTSVPGASRPSTTTRARSAVPVAASAPTPREAAIALTRRMVGEALVPAGSRRTATALPKMLRGPWETLAGGNLVTTKRAWATSDPPDAVEAFLVAHVPAGFDGRGGHGSVSSPTERVEYVVDQLSTLPPNIFAAGLEIGVESRGAGSLINVVAGAQWTPVRPDVEVVGASDSTVSILVLHAFPAGRPAIRRVVVTGASARAIVRAFNELRLQPMNLVHGCPAITRRSISYRIGFARSAHSKDDVVAVLGPCGDVGVTIGGRRAPTLWPSKDFDDAIARALGVPELHFLR